MTDETLELTFEISDPQEISTRPKWMNADWLVTIGTLLEVGSFVGVNGREITWSAPVVEQVIKTALNKGINIFHPNRPDERKENVGRVYGIFYENGVGKIKYVTWDKDANEGISDGRFKLSLEADVIGSLKSSNKYDAVRGTVNTAALVYSPAVPGAINESITAVALEQQQVAQSASAEPGIQFPGSAQLSKNDLSPCISLIEKNGFRVVKGIETNMEDETPEGVPEGTTPDSTPAVETIVEQEEPEVPEVVVPEVVPESTPAEPEPTEFLEMKAQMEAMTIALEAQTERMAKLEGTDLKTIKNKILKVAPKTDFTVLLEGARDVDEQKRILNARLSGLTSRDSPEVHLEGVDDENTGDKPDPKEVEDFHMKEYLGFEKNPLRGDDE